MPADQPSIKGSAIAAVIEDVQKLRDSGRLGEEQLEARLEAVDLALLDKRVQAALWYPIESYRRLTELLLDVEGRGHPSYVVDRGARAAERLWEAGLYIQLQHGEERAERARAEGGVLSERDSRLITSLSGAIFNFSRWTYRTESGEGLISVTDAAELPEISVHAARGFLEYVISRLRRQDTPVRAERTAPDRVEFRFALSLG